MRIQVYRVECIKHTSPLIEPHFAMLRLQSSHANRLFGVAHAPHKRLITRESISDHNTPRMKRFIGVGVSVSIFTAHGFTLDDLLQLGLSGDCFSAKQQLTPKFAGLEKKWDSLVTWTILDLVHANATFREICALGVTLPSLMGRDMFMHGFPLLRAMTMQNWRDFGMNKTVLLGMKADAALFRRLGWDYGKMVACWGFTPAEMHAVGFRLEETRIGVNL
jgi:hypothetical protein